MQRRQSAKLFLYSRRINSPQPTPHPQASVPPASQFWGEGHTRWRRRGWESPNSDEGHTLWYSLYVYMCFVILCLAWCYADHRGVNWYTLGGPSRPLDTKTINKKISLAFFIPESLKWKFTAIFFPFLSKLQKKWSRHFFQASDLIKQDWGKLSGGYTYTDHHPWRLWILFCLRFHNI